MNLNLSYSVDWAAPGDHPACPLQVPHQRLSTADQAVGGAATVRSAWQLLPPSLICTSSCPTVGSQITEILSTLILYTKSVAHCILNVYLPGSDSGHPSSQVMGEPLGQSLCPDRLHGLISHPAEPRPLAAACIIRAPICLLES